jgi:uncharacterized protein (TIGR02118 family)
MTSRVQQQRFHRFLPCGVGDVAIIALGATPVPSAGEIRARRRFVPEPCFWGDGELSGASVGAARREETLSMADRVDPLSTKGRTMVKAVVLYGPPEDPDAFERYYADTHTALAQKIPGLQRFEAGRGFATPDGSAVPYQRIAELTFEDMDALQAGFGSEDGQAAVNDIPNFATGGVTIFFAEID